MSTPTSASTPPAWEQQWLSRVPEILQQYELTAYSTEFLRANENVVFKVTEDKTGTRYALRLHCSRASSFCRVRRDAAAIASELLWLEAIANQTDIVVPQPIRTIDGEIAVQISSDCDNEHPPVVCSLLRWVEGARFDNSAPDAGPLARELGRTAARLHEHGCNWSKPECFTRPAYDQNRVNESVQLIAGGLAPRLLTDKQYDTIVQTASHITALMDALGTGPDVWGLGHFDLGAGNCLVSGTSIHLIDFSLCGFGHYMFDLVCALGPLEYELRKPCVEGYGEWRALPIDHIHLLDAFLLMAIFNAWAFHIGNAKQHHWIGPNIEKVVRSRCLPLLNGESFILGTPL